MGVKSYNISFKDVDLKEGIVTGYFASFNTLDSDGDIIEPGAFKKSISENGPNGKQLIKWLLDHDKYKVLGKLNRLEEDSTGLLYEGKVGRHTLGKDFLLMVEDGLINQHSFGYKTVKEQWDGQSKANRIKEVKLFEGSSVQFLGANENTPIVGVKSMEDAMEYVERLEKFINTTTATDETIIKLSERLKSLQHMIEPGKPTQEDVKPIDLKSIIHNSWKNINGN